MFRRTFLQLVGLSAALTKLPKKKGSIPVPKYRLINRQTFGQLSGGPYPTFDSIEEVEERLILLTQKTQKEYFVLKHYDSAYTIHELPEYWPNY